MMDVKVQNGHPPDSVYGLCVRHAHHNVVVAAEALRRVRLGVVAWRTHHHKGATCAWPSRVSRAAFGEEIVDRGNHQSSGTLGGRLGAAADDRVRVDVDTAAQQKLGADEGLVDLVEVRALMYPQQLETDGSGGRAALLRQRRRHVLQADARRRLKRPREAQAEAVATTTPAIRAVQRTCSSVTSAPGGSRTSSHALPISGTHSVRKAWRSCLNLAGFSGCVGPGLWPTHTSDV